MKQEINFRSTSGYRADDSADAYVQTVLSVNYPTVTAQGNNVGWENLNDPYAFNESLSNDVRLAGGQGLSTNMAASTYRIDLPATGSYRLRCAAGRVSAIRGVNISVNDNTTPLATLVTPKTPSAANRFYDATDVELTAANWPGSNQPKDVTFTSTILRIKVGGNVISGQSWAYIAHFSVESISSGGPSPAFLRNYYMNQGWA